MSHYTHRDDETLARSDGSVVPVNVIMREVLIELFGRTRALEILQAQHETTTTAPARTERVR